jgi:hypothetical protein
MKGSIRAVLATSAALSLTAFGAAAPASATENHKPKLTKQVGDWNKIDDTYKLPKGTACKDEVTVKEHAEARDTVYTDKHGQVVKVFSEFKDWSTVKFSATTKKHHKQVTRSVKLNQGGDAWARFKDEGKTVYVKAEGANWGQGSGIYGIPWSYGDISFTVVHADGSDYRIVNLDLSEAKKVKQVCYLIGSKPVWGKNVPPPA